jgi:hypothetical protein
MVGTTQRYFAQFIISLTLRIFLQSTKQEMIWDAAKAGDKALLPQCLVGASAGDLMFEKKDTKVRHRVKGLQVQPAW